MNEQDDLEALLKRTREHRLHALEQELDRRMSRLWRAPERRKLLIIRPALALASIAVLFLGAWLYDLSQSGGASPIVLRDARYERPRLVLREPGDPVRLTQQIAGVSEQAPPEHLYLVEPGLHTGIFRLEAERYTAVVEDQAGNRFLAEESGRIVKRVIQGDGLKEEVVLEGLDHPNGLAFDRDGDLLVLEGGRGRIWGVEPVEGEIKAGSPVSVLVEGFGISSVQERDVAAKREGRLALELTPKERIEPVYLTVSASGDIFVGGQVGGEVVVYKIGRKSFKWWKFYCLYRC